MTAKQLGQFMEIRRLLKEAYDDYFKHGDGCHKPSEGYVEVYYQNIFEADTYVSQRACGLGIYSYVLGPLRMHHFDSFEEALETVREWHKSQLEDDYSKW